ncbi:hypothetical protein [Prosthecobacter debontii]|uniref:hypothetical protein n=1 Tax=Prosthecobacter debontii TaxID=48467 RepID=UPI00099951FA|nr:hypothetical protein [Prosthecobacter debontii]
MSDSEKLLIVLLVAVILDSAKAAIGGAEKSLIWAIVLWALFGFWPMVLVIMAFWLMIEIIDWFF